MASVEDILREQAHEALTALGARGLVTAEHVANSVLRRVVYWEKPIAGGEKLVFVRFFSPVIQREEVFLGNVLLNDFLSKAFRAAADAHSAGVRLVANDLESYYFLVRTALDATQLAEAFRAEVECRLPDLFFGVQDATRGIYGSLEVMLDFDKANVEPFPVFIMPKNYVGRLERSVRESIQRKIAKTPLNRNPTSIMANLAFFYCRDGEEMQSPPRFLGRLAFRHGVILPSTLEAALNIPKTEQSQVIELIERISDEGELTSRQGRALRDLVLQIADNVAIPTRFGWLAVFLAGAKKAGTQEANWEWELDGVTRLLSKTASSDPQDVFDDIVKGVIAHRLSHIDLCSPKALRDLMREAVEKLGEKVDADAETWRMPYVADKFLPYTERALVHTLLDGVSLGYHTLSVLHETVDVGCRVCGIRRMEAQDKSILMGQNTHKFHNQSGKQTGSEAPKTCLRCATCTYLMVKLTGSEAIGQPQVPKMNNTIFHYGRHDDAGVEVLTRELDLIWNLVRTHQDREREVWDIRKAVSELKKKWEAEKTEEKKGVLAQHLQVKEGELEQAEARLERASDDLFKVCPWLEEPTPPSESCGLEVLSVGKLGEARTERHVLGLGMGGYRMILFVMPPLKPPRGKKGEPPSDPYLAQRRFSDSRVIVTAFLSFLRELCGCDGPFYYQSLPALTPDAFQRDTFYVRNQPIGVDQAQSEYGVVTQLAWKLVRESGPDGVVRKVVLAERLLEDPLGTFSSVLRDSEIMGQTEGSYKKVGGKYREGWRAQDLTEYARFIQRLSRLQEVNNMALQINHEQLDAFCSELFRTLDGLGLLPLHLWAKPSEFEKYPRLLFGAVQRYGDVEAGFREWESRVLRDAPYRKEDSYLELEGLHRWMTQNKSILVSKANQQHLRTSLYARVFYYLYPRRVLANAYCEAHKGQTEVAELFARLVSVREPEEKRSARGALEELLRDTFPGTVSDTVAKVKETYSDEWETVVSSARSKLIASAPYYAGVLCGRQAMVPTITGEQAETQYFGGGVGA